jgi:hypothetical protein
MDNDEKPAPADIIRNQDTTDDVEKEDFIKESPYVNDDADGIWASKDVK